MELKRANHCVYKIRYHLVLCVKYRKKLLFEDERISFLKEVLSGVAERYEFTFEAIGSDGDHVHIFAGAAPRYAPSEVIGIIKSITARQIFIRFPEIKELLWGGEFWSDGGYIGTVGEGVNADIIRRYIEKQGKKMDKNQMRLIDFK